MNKENGCRSTTQAQALLHLKHGLGYKCIYMQGQLKPLSQLILSYAIERSSTSCTLVAIHSSSKPAFLQHYQVNEFETK